MGQHEELPPKGRRRRTAGKAGRNGERDFHGEKRRNKTRASTSDPDAWLYCKGPGQAAKLAYMGHVHDGEPPWSGGRHAADLATGTAEREAALAIAEARPGNRRIILHGERRAAYHSANIGSNLMDLRVARPNAT